MRQNSLLADGKKINAMDAFIDSPRLDTHVSADTDEVQANDSADRYWANRALIPMGLKTNGCQRVTMQKLMVLVACSLLSTSLYAADESAAYDQIQFFEMKVRPVLAEHCYGCHAVDKQKGNLRLDSLSGMLSGGDSGAVVTPGNPEKSLLVNAINYVGYEMPPDGKLPQAKIDDITAWVKMGAPWPGAKGEAITAVRKSETITEADRAYWAFQPILRSKLPMLKSHPQPKHEIDAFVVAKLEEIGIEPLGTATARELVRRSFFDLIGLPPTPDEMNKWIEKLTPVDTETLSTAAYSELIDELLSRPQYGERWGRHWLDVVRFAQTNGYERDGEKPLAWRYRDYVISALNTDKPYDRFVMEQLAGDELEDATSESRIATGFYRLGVHDDEPDDARQAEFDGLDDAMVATGAAFMGLTLGCARCHSHKFDPIPHTDYYRTLAFFRNVQTYQTPDYTIGSATLLPISDEATVREAIENRDGRLAAIDAALGSTSDANERNRLEEEKRNQKLDGIEWTLAVREREGEVPTTNVLIRGNPGTPGDEVQLAFLGVLGGEKPEIIPPKNKLFPSSGRRLALARWIASPQNPLTARVMVNRIWHYHFGRGIVTTTSDFGKSGAPPTNPELLDWLATEFIDSGWSIKKLHKTIMLSDTYRRSSHAPQATKRNEIASNGIHVDPGNQFLWRHNLRRLEAEAIRDTVLAVSDQLNGEQGGRGFFPRLGGEVLAGSSRPGDGWEVSPPEQQRRRSVYTFIKRTVMSPMLDTFDYTNTAQPMPERSTTTVAPQALMLLNDSFMQEQAAMFAERVRRQTGDNPDKQIDVAYQLAIQRHPNEHELAVAKEFLVRQARGFSSARSQLAFYPDVPVSLHDSYLNRLTPTDFISGPRHGWTYGRGRWGGSYEGIMTVDADRGPYALWEGARFVDGIVSVNILPSRASELASVLVRAKPDGDVFQGYEIALLPRANRISLRRHAGDVTPLAEAFVESLLDSQLPIKIEILGDRIRVWLRNAKEPVMDVVDSQPLLDKGQVGIRTWGAALTMDDFWVTTNGRSADVGIASVDVEADVASSHSTTGKSTPSSLMVSGETPDDSSQRALQSLCLLILNLNELIYID